MTSEQIMEMMQLYKQQGKDIDTLINDCGDLLSARKTPNIKLNQWHHSDKPCMEDFNEDNKIIDEKIRELQVNKVDMKNTIDINLPIAIPEMTVLYKAVCSKNDLGNVFVSFSLTKPQTIKIIENSSIATLPIGFRPEKRTTVPSTVRKTGDMSIIAVNFDIATNGAIIYHGPELPIGSICQLAMNASFNIAA